MHNIMYSFDIHMYVCISGIGPTEQYLFVSIPFTDVMRNLITFDVVIYV